MADAAAVARAVGTESVAGVVRRLGAIPALPEAAAELAVRVRREHSRPGEVADALAEGRIIKTFAFRGATHLMTPQGGGAYLALRAASRNPPISMLVPAPIGRNQTGVCWTPSFCAQAHFGD